MEEFTQLEMDFDGDEVTIKEPEAKETSKSEPYNKTSKCKHNIKIKSFKRDYLSYCSKCGKIFSVKHKKGE